MSKFEPRCNRCGMNSERKDKTIGQGGVSIKLWLCYDCVGAWTRLLERQEKERTECILNKGKLE